MGHLENCTASLGIHGEELLPAELTQLLLCEPTQGWKKNEVRSLPPRNPVKGAWLLNSSFSRSTNLEEQIIHLLDQVNNDPAVWEQINQRYKTRIFCGVWLTGANQGFEFSPGLLARLSNMGLKLDFDIYTFSKDVNESFN